MRSLLLISCYLLHLPKLALCQNGKEGGLKLMKWANEHSIVASYPDFKIVTLEGYPAYQWFAKLQKGNNVTYQDLTCYKKTSENDYKDTLLRINTFQPDPLSPLDINYGGIYQDFNDSATAALNNCLVSADIRLRYDSSNLIIQNRFGHLSDFSPPYSTTKLSVASPQQLNRHDSLFEAYNAFFHISRAGAYLDQLGFSNAIDTSLAFDHDGMGGADESAYYPAIRSIAFGKGGVDDAEDADIITHEYFHSVHQKLAPFTNIGTERRALEEGNCDYFAWRMSTFYTLNQLYYLFNWDGHNPFWAGRVVNVMGQYPAYLTSEIYHDGQLWSSALVAASQRIGGRQVDSLVLESISRYRINISMSSAAKALLKADSTHHGARHSFTLRPILEQYGFVNPLIVSNNTGIKKSISVALNNGCVEIQGNESNHSSVYSLDGRCLLIESSNNFSLPKLFGAVIIVIRDNSGRIVKRQLLVID